MSWLGTWWVLGVYLTLRWLYVSLLLMVLLFIMGDVPQGVVGVYG